MKKVGREVLFLKTSENNPRNGEGTFIRLKNGDIMYAFTEYYGTDWKDHATARISACISKDEGETWSEKRVLLEKDEKAQNIMSTNLIRLSNGDLGLIYLRKELEKDGGCRCMPVMRRSADEGASWSDLSYCTSKLGYYCPFNGSAVKLKNGRILFPVAYIMDRYDALKLGIDTKRPECGPFVEILYSDDDGVTWNTLPHKFVTPYGDSIGFTEPGMYEHQNGDLWIWFRTPYGYQYQSLSKDGGMTWSPVMPNFFFTSPDSPMQVERTGEYTAAVFNPVPYYAGNPNREQWKSPKRTPLALVISTNDGVDLSENIKKCANGSFSELEKNLYLIEDDKNDSYCYPAIFGGKDYMLVAYYHSNGTGICLNSAKIVKIMYDEIKPTV